MNKKLNKEYIDFYAELVMEIKKKMLVLDLTQSDLATMTGLKQPHICRILQKRPVRLDTLFKILSALNMKLKIPKTVAWFDKK